MTFPTPATGRLVRSAVVVVLLLLCAPARGAGTGGVDVSPYPGLVNGKQVTAFHTEVPSRGSSRVRYSLRNTTGATASARLFSASASRSGGTFTIGAAGSSSYIDFPDHQVTLRPRETRIESFSVHPGPHGRPKGQTYGAIVVEVKNGSIVQQAAVVVYLQPGPLVPLPLLVVLIAAGVLALTGIAFVVTTRRRP